MQKLLDKKSDTTIINQIAWVSLLLIGLSFNWSILRNYSLPFFGGTLNIADFILLFIIFSNIFKVKEVWGGSKTTYVLILLHIGIFIIGTISLSLNENASIPVLIRSSRGYLGILIALAYGKIFNYSLLRKTLLSICLSCPIALIGYFLNYLGILRYGSFDYIESSNIYNDVTQVIVSDNEFSRFFFIDTPCILFCICISMFLFATSKSNKLINIVFIIGIISSYILLLINLGRSFIIIAVIASIFSLNEMRKYNRKKAFYSLIIILFSMASSIVIFLTLQGSESLNILLYWFQGLIDADNPSNASVTVRGNHFLSAYEAFADSPLYGQGIGADFTEYHLKNGSLENPYNFGNTFSLRIAQTGLIGLTLWILFNVILVMFIYAKKSINYEEKFLRNTLLIIHISVFLSCLISGDYSTVLSFGLIYGCIILITDYINTCHFKLN